jgi:hypothetical protein
MRTEALETLTLLGETARAIEPPSKRAVILALISLTREQVAAIVEVKRVRKPSKKGPRLVTATSGGDAAGS